MGRMNAIIGAHGTYCDGGHFDRHLLGMLQISVGSVATLNLSSFEELTFRQGRAAHFGSQAWLDENPPPHRAGEDAERLKKAFARGLGVGNRFRHSCADGRARIKSR